MKILANDGLDASGIEALEKIGFEVITNKVPQEDLIRYINQENIEVLLVRSATQVRKELINQCPGIKIVGRGGVGMDNIDVSYCESKNISVINTPEASSASVAELVFAHLFTGIRFLQDSNRHMPTKGNIEFAKLKNNYAKGVELRGRTIGIIGFGRIGQEVAKIALGLGMKVLASDLFVSQAEIRLDFQQGKSLSFNIYTVPIEDILKSSDFISLHVPAQKEGYLIGANELEQMKPNAAIINCSRGGIIDEMALIAALDAGKLSFAGLDVFENEPQPKSEVLQHSKISLSPHIGASSGEAQDRIGLSLAKQISEIYGIEK